MDDTAHGEMQLIAADLDSREWVETGLARLEDYLASWNLFTQLYPPDPQ